MGTDKVNYKALDMEIKDTLLNHYCKKYKEEDVKREVFQYLDSHLGSYKSWANAKNMKKLLTAISKSKILSPIELDALYKKVNKFLSKGNAAKEKEHIENKIKTAVIAHGENARAVLDEEEKVYKEESDDLDDLTDEEVEEEKAANNSSSGKSGRNSSRKSSNSGSVYFKNFKKNTMDKQLSYHEIRKLEHTDLLDAPPHRYVAAEKYILQLYQKV